MTVSNSQQRASGAWYSDISYPLDNFTPIAFKCTRILFYKQLRAFRDLLQIMIIGFDCMSRQDILHAMLHVLGFWDEVTHPQRDQYVRVMWENIQPSKKFLHWLFPFWFHFTTLNTVKEPSWGNHVPATCSRTKNQRSSVFLYGRTLNYVVAFL